MHLFNNSQSNSHKVAWLYTLFFCCRSFYVISNCLLWSQKWAVKKQLICIKGSRMSYSNFTCCFFLYSFLFTFFNNVTDRIKAIELKLVAWVSSSVCMFSLSHIQLPPTSSMMPPVIAVRDLRTLSSAPQVVHFIPMHATPSPAMDTIIPTIISARVAWRSPDTKTEKEFWLKDCRYLSHYTAV